MGVYYRGVHVLLALEPAVTVGADLQPDGEQDPRGHQLVSNDGLAGP